MSVPFHVSPPYVCFPCLGYSWLNFYYYTSALLERFALGAGFFGFDANRQALLVYQPPSVFLGTCTREACVRKTRCCTAASNLAVTKADTKLLCNDCCGQLYFMWRPMRTPTRQGVVPESVSVCQLYFNRWRCPRNPSWQSTCWWVVNSAVTIKECLATLQGRKEFSLRSYVLAM